MKQHANAQKVSFLKKGRKLTKERRNLKILKNCHSEKLLLVLFVENICMFILSPK